MSASSSAAVASSSSASPSTLAIDLHVAYIQSLDTNRDSLSYYFTEHLRMNGIYWGFTALSLMNRSDALPKQEMCDWVMSCWVEEDGAFSPYPGHDVNLHSSLSAIQILAMQGSLYLLEESKKMDKLVAYILSLQDPQTGSFAGDILNERSSRFSYCAVAALSLLGRLDMVDVDLTVQWIKGCRNFDGGFGMCPGAESHAAYVWTCVGTLAILDRLDIVEADTLCWWLCERQLPNGGLNGRPEKLEDVCYSWWALASLSILGRGHWIDGDKLKNFILSAQDPEKGGIADRPDDVADVWHTVFGIAGLSLLAFPGLAMVDPIYCMPSRIVDGLLADRNA